jgi:glycosyltransferase involved in cell wall biosynthesis
MLRRFDNSLCTKASPIRCHQCFPDFAPEHFFVRDMWFKRHLSVVDAFTVPSRFMIDRYVAWGLDPAKITYVANGQPDYSGGRAVHDQRRKRNRFGFFGQLVDCKGVWLLLQAVQLLRAEGFTDFVVEINGDNLKYASEARREEIEEFQSRERELPLNQRIVAFNGSYSVDQLGQRMARVDWCIVPSVWWEIFALVISEAWMFKRPVIASNVGGPKERVTDGKDGLLFEVADAASLAHTMRRACTEEGLWDRLVGGIAPPATEDIMVERFLSVYQGGTAGNGVDSAAAGAAT